MRQPIRPIASVTLGLATTLALIGLYPLRSLALLKESPKTLVDQTWQIVYQDYVDRSFNQNDWLAVRQDYLQRSYTSKQQAYEAIQGMLAKLEDPYTEFLNPQQIKELANNISGDFIGVGLTVMLDQAKEWQVVEPIPGSPAAAAGVLPQDVIVKINGKSTAEIDPNQASQYIIGPVGSQVFLTLQRGSQTLNLKLVRDRVDLNPVTYRLQKTATGKIGYIRIPVFTSKAPAAVQKAIQSLEKQQVKGYILDLRGNPGGIYETSLAIARMWLSNGKITSYVDRQGKTDELATGSALTQKPLSVLVDSNSASASEVLAGALQDNRRASLIGTKTLGKGLVQSLEPLQDGSGVKITIARYYTPKGRDINQVGIQPDRVVPLSAQQWQVLNQQGAVATADDLQYVKALDNLTQSIQARSSKPGWHRP